MEVSTTVGSTDETDCETAKISTVDDIQVKTDMEDEILTLPHSASFAEGEKVLAYFDYQLYEARVMKNKYRVEEGWQYHIHYIGWSKKWEITDEIYSIWDEWVDKDRLMKFTEENSKKQEELKKQNPDKNPSPGQASNTKSESGCGCVAQRKKQKSDSLDKCKITDTKRLEKLVNLQIPLALKKQLVNDYDFITHMGKLVKLPRTPNVDGILKKYLDYKLKKDGLISDSIREIQKGLRCYFDKALPIMLLYKSEHQQYENSITNEVSPSTVYGAEHLLRLFVKLPDLLINANIEMETVKEMQQVLVDFLKFLQKNQSDFFLSTYHISNDTETSSNIQNTKSGALI